MKAKKLKKMERFFLLFNVNLSFDAGKAINNDS